MKKQPRKLGDTVGFFGKALVTRFLLLFLLSLSIAFLLSPQLTGPIADYQIGQFTTSAVRAPYDFSVIDPADTERKKADAVTQTPPVADYDSQIANPIVARFTEAFAPLAKLRKQADLMAVAPEEKLKWLSERRKAALVKQYQDQAEKFFADKVEAALPELEKNLGVQLEPGEVAFLKRYYDNGLIEEFETLAEAVYESPVVVDVNALKKAVIGDPEKKDGPGKLALKDKATGKETLFSNIPSLRELNQVQGLLDENRKTLLPDQTEAGRALLIRIMAGMTKPNLALNTAETAARQAAAADAVIPTSYSFKKNQFIVGDGQKVTEQIDLALEYIRGHGREEKFLARLFGTAFLLYLLILLGFWIADINDDRFVILDRDFVFISAGLALSVFLFRLWMVVAAGVLERVPEFSEQALFLLFPAAAVAMNTRYLINFKVSLVMTAIISILFGMLADQGLIFSVYTFVVSLVAIHKVGGCSRRAGVLGAGLWTGLASMIGAVGLMLVAGQELNLSILWNLLGAFLGGLFAGFTVVAFSPLAEMAFGYTTNITLLEMANYENPLLRKIMLEAPGTFQHSISIGILAEAAAEAVGANSLLTRVGALYHDAGKSLNPLFFTENQSGSNPHDRLTPKESARVILNHVTDGVTLVRENRLGERIADFVREHHGTGLIKYFIAKARQNDEQVNPADYRYPGPKPRSRETGILMIADQVEATSRSMVNASEDEYHEMIVRTIERIRMEGQLDDCPLTLRNLAAIQRAFVQVLMSSHHQRIKYPEQKQGEKL